MRGLIGVLVAVAATGCGKDKSDTEAAPTPATAEDVIGTWRVVSAKFEQAPDAVVLSGSLKYRFSSDGIATSEGTSYTQQLGGVKYYDACSNYTAGEFKLENGTIFVTKGLGADVSGKCGSDTSRMIYTLDDGSIEAGMLDGQLVLTLPLTYADDKGVSKSDKFVSTWERIPDPNGALDGTWKLDAAYYAGPVCDQKAQLKATPLQFSGSWELTLAGDKYSTVQTGFAFGDNEKCTGKDSGTVARSKLKFETTQTEADACLKEGEDTTKTVLEGDWVSPSGALVSILGNLEATEACPNGEYFSLAMVAKR